MIFRSGVKVSWATLESAGKPHTNLGPLPHPHPWGLETFECLSNIVQLAALRIPVNLEVLLVLERVGRTYLPQGSGHDLALVIDHFLPVTGRV